MISKTRTNSLKHQKTFGSILTIVNKQTMSLHEYF